MKILKTLILFVEGADGVGKSTITRSLSKRLNLPVLKMLKAKVYFKKGRETIEEFSYIFNQVLLQLKNTSYIVDRGPLSSLVYSEIYNRKSKLSYIYPLLREIDPLILFLTTSETSILFERKKKDRVITIADRLKILEGYEKFFKNQKLVRYLRINTAHKTPSQIVNEILKYLEEKKYIES